jgi:hypothetical protein
MIARVTDADVVWNRACLEDVGPNARAGDRALSALIKAHSLVMNGGVLHAVECLEPAEIEAACAGFRFFDVDAGARIFEAAQQIFADASEEDELSLDKAYAPIDDDLLVARFRRHFLENRELYAPISAA